MLRHALERAGNRLATAVRPRRVSQQVKQIVASTPTPLIASRLGEAHVAALGLTNEALLDSAFETLEVRWDAWVAQAQRQGRAAIVEEGEDLSDEDDEALARQMERDRAAGWAVLGATLVRETTTRLYAPEQPTSLGERDSSLIVSPGVLREALQVAGGGPVSGSAGSTATSGAGRGGLLSGQTVREMFRAAALRELGWVWVYGDPGTRTRPFEPHMNLDAESFDSWEDEALANPEDFPETDFYFPSDHFGCQCTFARDGASTVETEEETEDEAA